MKKTITSLAVAAALIPFAASADVGIYGKVHLSADSLDDGTDSSTYLSSNSSRFGVRGSTDFGNGLSGLFQLEGGVTMASAKDTDGSGDNDDGFWGTTRDSYLGLKGDFGTFLAGRLPAANQYVYDANLFADQVGDAGNLTGGSWPGRADNALHYVTPALGNVTVALTHVMEQGVKDGSANGIRVTFNIDKLNLGLTWLGFDKGLIGGSEDASVAALSAGYDFGFADVKAMLVQNTAEGGVDGADRDIFTLGAAFAAGAGTAKIQYTSAGESDNGTADDATMLAIGYDYPLFKNATVYAAYAKVDNEANSSANPFNWGHGANPGVAAPGQDPSAFSIGLVYDF
ncbi:porin [Sulfurivermis fontis]|jgi:predicted porin|uniref:porin n=1 Tax=Sulfurivermis fontis TaxID=1972068 RepID=UPI00155980FF|nr:porin [Sulfurivermis fontis]